MAVLSSVSLATKALGLNKIISTAELSVRTSCYKESNTIDDSLQGGRLSSVGLFGVGVGVSSKTGTKTYHRKVTSQPKKNPAKARKRLRTAARASLKSIAVRKKCVSVFSFFAFS